MMGCVIFTSFTVGVVGESVGYLLESHFVTASLFGTWNRIHLKRCLNDVLYYWETQAQCCTAAKVALCLICSPAPLTPHVCTPFFWRRFLAKILLFLLALCVIWVFCTLKNSHLLNSLEQTNLFLKWLPLVLACLCSWLPSYLFVCHPASS